MNVNQGEEEEGGEEAGGKEHPVGAPFHKTVVHTARTQEPLTTDGRVINK